MPTRQNLIPANRRGGQYFKPILTPAKAVDQSIHATIAGIIILKIEICFFIYSITV